jgi:uncharacterized protein (DUF1501 family)
MNAPTSPDGSSITRRRFLTGAGIMATAAVAAGYGVSVWARGPAPSTRRGSTADPGGHSPRGTLVVVELGGGNDGLNTVVPSDGRYRDLRPTLAVTDAIPIDKDTGLHPKLTKLAARYRAGTVAIVEGIGYPDPNLSHFASLANWWSARTDGHVETGWLGRYLDATVGFEDPLAAISIGPTPSSALLGDRSFATSIADAGGLGSRAPAWVDHAGDVVAAWRDFAPAPTDPGGLLTRVEQSIWLTVAARDELRSELRTTDSGAGGGAAGSGPAAVPSLVEHLDLAARLASAPHPPRIIYIAGAGDFDTHEGQATRHPLLLGELDTAIDRFFSVLGSRANPALVMTVSEFGRRATENGSGTDHGTAAPQLLVGPAVMGGRHGTRPALDRLDRHGNLVATVDFRSLYATVLHEWLRADPEPILGARYETLPLFS